MSGEPGTMVPEHLDITTGEIHAPADLRLAGEPMTHDQAVEATNRANAYAKRLPMVVKEVFDGRAWQALGYESWEEYVDDALVISRRYANMLLRAAVNLELLAETFDVDVALFGLPERVLRSLDAGTMVPAVTDALAELSPDATDEERAEVIETTVRTETTKVTKAKAEQSAADKLKAAEERGRQKALADLAARQEREATEAAAQAERERKAADRARKSSGEDPPPAPSLEPGQVSPPAPATSTGEAGADTPSDTAAPGDTGTTRPGESDEGVPGDRLTPSSPALPADWRDRLACAVYFARLDPGLLRPVLDDDDRADLTVLRDHLNVVLEED